MEKLIVYFCVILIPAAGDHHSALSRTSYPDLHKQRLAIPDEKSDFNYKEPHKLELIVDFGDSSNANNEKVKRRKERVQRRKDKGGKFIQERGRPREPAYDLARHTLRNEEKATLVRSKTMEILKNGLKILKPSEHPSRNENASPSRLNESLLEKILFSSAAKHDILLSASGAYRLPIGAGGYLKDNEQASPPQEGFNRQQIKRQNEARSKISTFAQDSEYDFLADVQMNSTNNLEQSHDTVNLDKNVGTALEYIVNALKNLSHCSSESCDQEEEGREDSCQKWLNCRRGLDRAFVGVYDLPSCPCTYPSSIFYEDTVWDEISKKYFRWRDASGESERLDIYKPGAAYCIRSLLTQGSASVSSQQCCYDRNLRLLTRGSGAGTINFISPDVSRILHNTVDILPWRLCKGDFTRYNKARNPNNGNNCPENPSEEEFQLQVKLSKIY